MKKRKPTLKTIDLSNGEFAEVIELGVFLQWMKQEKTPIPESFDGAEADHLMVRYILHRRKESLAVLLKKGKITQKAFDNMVKRYAE